MTSAEPRTYPPAPPIWCAGCGHYGVQAALEWAFDRLGLAPHEIVVLAGIGCSGTVQNNMGTYGYHALHGRVLPTATGVVLTNPDLTVVAVGGDGDGYAIGAGHLVHAFRRNAGMVYVVMANGVYGLTKGQPSPMESVGRPQAAETGFDAIRLGLAIPGTTFLARGFARYPEQLRDLTEAALRHAAAGHGFAFLEVLSPCVAYHDTYASWDQAVVDLASNSAHDPSDRVRATVLATRLAEEGRIPTGLVYRRAGTPFEAGWAAGRAAAPVGEADRRVRYRAMLAEYRL